MTKFYISIFFFTNQRVSISLILLFFLLFISHSSFAVKDDSSQCLTYFSEIILDSKNKKLEPQVSQNQEINTVGDLFKAFSKGSIPDLDNTQQRKIFLIYMRLRFFRSNFYYTDLNLTTLDNIAQLLKKYPHLK